MKKKLYTFLEYLVEICDLDREFLMKEHRHVLANWDAHGEPYLEFCEAHDYESENLEDF